MATRNEKLSRLRIASPCTASWDGMTGDTVRRHCAQCDRQVFDFSRMTPRQIEARVEASGGQLCARITRAGDGCLVTLPTPEPPFYWTERRASPVAAALVGALLALRGAAAGSASAAAQETSAAPEPDRPDSGRAKPETIPRLAAISRVAGIIIDLPGAPLPGASVLLHDSRTGMEASTVTGTDGRYAFDDLAPGNYSLSVNLEGFSTIFQPDIAVTAGRVTNVEVTMPPSLDQITAGEMVLPADEPLRQVFAESDLVVTGIVGATVGIDPEEPAEVETEIRVTAVLKGRHAGRSLFVEHGEDEETGRLAPGTKVLAFLDAGDSRPGRRIVYVAAGWAHGVDALSEDALAAYAARLDALERITRRGDPQPEDLAEWLVATAEEPLTRKEATEELAKALSFLNELATERNLPVDQAAADVQAEVADRLAEGKPFQPDEALSLAGAYLTESDKHRLTRALLATHGLSRGDFELYEIVRPWAADPANEWLTREFRQAEPIDDGVGRDVMGRLAEVLGSDSLKALLDEADAEVEARFASLTEEGLAQEVKRATAELGGMQKELRIRFREMLGE
ncbi:MAG TPA: carboxypeptidase-like regulatory domain-containing protein [Thermoanaerobaculia bacterium]|jgi:hypothetical protein|nr:carboxypeptidase-like regulatory domain-containing protein [Thermoanaerobaculia bacterium]